MKRFPLLSFLPLVALVFAAACSDSTAPANSGMVRIPTDPAYALGDPPPPPVDAAVVICADGVCVEADGSYFSNGGTTPALTAAMSSAKGEGTCIYSGPSWVKFSNRQSPDVMVSTFGQIKCSHLSASGRGTIQFGDVTVFLDQVLLFDNPPECSTFCGSFTATTDPAGGAEGVVLNREFYNEFCQIVHGEGDYLDCGEVIG